MEKLKYPRGEQVCVEYFNMEHELLFILTTKGASKDFYFLYELENGEFKKLGKAKTPEVLEEKYNVRHRMGVVDE